MEIERVTWKQRFEVMGLLALVGGALAALRLGMLALVFLLGALHQQ